MSGSPEPRPDRPEAPGDPGPAGAGRPDVPMRRPEPLAEPPEPATAPYADPAASRVEPEWLSAAGLPDAAAGPPALRVSDADRERTVSVLHAAAADGRLDPEELEARVQGAYGARFAEELRRLTVDLEADPAHEVAAPASAPRRMPVRRDGGPASNWVVSIMGGAERKGRWRVGETCNVVDVMGGSEVDLTEAELSAERTTIRVVSIMGGSEIRVPDGLNVEISEFAIMGGNEVRIGEHRPDPGGPTVRIEMFALMGGSSVKRGRKRTRAEKKEAKRLERERRRAEGRR